MVLAWRCGLTDRNGTFQPEFGDPFMRPTPVMTEWFFDPVFSAGALRRMERIVKKTNRYLQETCSALEKQLAAEPLKNCAVRLEASVWPAYSIKGELVWMMVLVICERAWPYFEIKAWLGSENTIRLKSVDIRGQLNEQLRQSGVEAMICERGFNGSLAGSQAPL